MSCSCGARTSCIAVGQTPEAAALAARYLLGLAWSMIPAWCFIALRNFMGAVNRPEPALWITLVAIPVNALLAYALIHGHFGLPRLDLLGAGLATTFVNVGMCVAAVWVCYACRPFKKYRVLGRFWRVDWELMRQLIVIGVPISGTMLLEWGLFSSAAILVGWIGTTALAAHQIALQIAAILFMVPFGISMAATVRVGHAVGRARSGRDAARRLRGAGARRRDHGRADADRRRVPQRHSAALPRRRGRGGRRDGAACRRAAAARRDLVRRRRHARHRGRRAARA